jgi:hypothetical protein
MKTLKPTLQEETWVREWMAEWHRLGMAGDTADSDLADVMIMDLAQDRWEAFGSRPPTTDCREYVEQILPDFGHSIIAVGDSN